MVRVVAFSLSRIQLLMISRRTLMSSFLNRSSTSTQKVACPGSTKVFAELMAVAILTNRASVFQRYGDSNSAHDVSRQLGLFNSVPDAWQKTISIVFGKDPVKMTSRYNKVTMRS